MIQVANHSFKYDMLSNFWHVSYKVCISKNPTLSDAYVARGKLYPPKLRWSMRPSLRLDHGMPQWSSWCISRGISTQSLSATSWSAKKSLPFTVSYTCDSIVSPSSSNITAAVPPSADTECERITCNFDMTAILSLGAVLAADMAALSPASPEPHISRSYSSMVSTIIVHGRSVQRY